MALSDAQLAHIATHLHACQQQNRDTHKVTDDYPDMTWEEAYAVQERIRADKLASGARVIGYKAGLTSHAKMKQMGVVDPVFGFLVDAFQVEDATAIRVDDLIHPKVEPEIAFVTRHELKGPGCHVAAVLAASDVVMPGLEVIDSRYRDFKFDLKSVVADNTSAARFILGKHAVDGRTLDLRTAGVVFEKNGEPIAFSAGAAVLGHPAAAVAMLVNHLGRRGQTLPAGSIVLSGGITEAVAVAAGDEIKLHIQGMGSVSVRFT